MLKHVKSGLSTPLDESAEPVPVPDAPLAIVRESPESLRRKFESRLDHGCSQRPCRSCQRHPWQRS